MRLLWRTEMAESNSSMGLVIFFLISWDRGKGYHFHRVNSFLIDLLFFVGELYFKSFGEIVYHPVIKTFQVHSLYYKSM